MSFGLWQIDQIVAVAAPEKVQLSDLELEERMNFVLFFGFKEVF
jgi:hypothetical protein